MVKVFMLNPKAERQASPGVPYVELSDYLSLESRHRDLVAAARDLCYFLENNNIGHTDALRKALKEEQ